MKFLKIVIQSLKSTKIYIIMFFILSIILNYLTTYIPVIIQYFIDYLLKQNTNNKILENILKMFQDKFSFIISICIILIAVQLTIILATYIRSRLKSKILQEFQYELKLKLFEHIQNLTYQDFYHNSLADLVQNSTEDVNNIVKFIESQLTYILDIVLIIIFAIVQLINIDLRLSSIMIMCSGIIIYMSIGYYKKSKDVIKGRLEKQRNLYAKMNDNYENLKFIKLNNLQEQEKKDFELKNREFNNFNKQKVVIDTKYKKGISVLIRVQPAIIFILSGYLYMLGAVSIGSIYVTINYSNKVTGAFADISQMIEELNSFRISYKRLNELLELTKEEIGKIKEINIKNKNIVFKKANIIVNGEIILKDLNFTIKENEKILLLGATGSGKSILLKTLIGFYEYRGSIKIGEYEVRDLNKKSIRENICLLLQDSYLFSRTIAENIKILSPYMSKEQMINISKFFVFDEDVQKLKDGYDSKIGRKGITLSKGQKQRLVLIRAFTKTKSIMIFDDSFSAIDKVNKKEILNNLMGLEEQFTTIMITHDIELADKFDKVIYLKNRQAIVGTHKELLENLDYRKVYEISKDKIGEEYV